MKNTSIDVLFYVDCSILGKRGFLECTFKMQPPNICKPKLFTFLHVCPGPTPNNNYNYSQVSKIHLWIKIEGRILVVKKSIHLVQRLNPISFGIFSPCFLKYHILYSLCIFKKQCFLTFKKVITAPSKVSLFPKNNHYNICYWTIGTNSRPIQRPMLFFPHHLL